MGEGLSKSPFITKSLTKTCNWVAPCKQHVRAAYLNKGQAGFKIFLALGTFLERPGNISGPRENFKIKTCSIVAQFSAHKPVKFALLTDSFIVSFSKLLKLWSWMQTRQTQNRFPGPKSDWDFREKGPCGTWHSEKGHLVALCVLEKTTQCKYCFIRQQFLKVLY